MPITHGIASAPTLHVRCTAKHCMAPADTRVEMVPERTAPRPEVMNLIRNLVAVHRAQQEA